MVRVRPMKLSWAIMLLCGGLIASPASPEASAQDLSAQDLSGRQLRPHHLNVEFHRAETALKSGASVLEAKARVDRVLNELPNDAEALKLRARVNMTMGRHEDALRDAKRAVQLDHGDGEAYLILSEAARLTNNKHLAVESLDAAAERVMEDAEFHIRMSWNAALLGHFDRSAAYARIAIALDPERPAGYYQLARAFVQQDKTDEAASTLARGLRQQLLDPVVIQSDSLLAALAVHPELQGLLN